MTRPGPVIALLSGVAFGVMLVFAAVRYWPEDQHGGVDEPCNRDGTCMGKLSCKIRNGTTSFFVCQP